MTDSSVHLEGQVDSLTTTLLDGAKQGDQHAWRRLVDLYLPLVYQWCRRQGLQDADVLDVGQEVLRRMAQHLVKFRRERPGDTFRGWLRQVTRNAVCDHFRRKQKQPVGSGDSDAAAALANIAAPPFEDDETTRSDEVEILYSRLIALVSAEFPARDWQAFQMVAVDSLTPAEAAEALGITRNQVYLAKSRILRRLREEFGDFQTAAGS